MKISLTLGTIIILFFLVLGGALLGLFYFAPNDLGIYSEIKGEVRGDSVRRWTLKNSDVLITSRQAGEAQKGDVLFITENSEQSKRYLRVVRDSDILVFSQLISVEFRDAFWDPIRNYFQVTSVDKDKELILIPKDESYKLVPSEL